MVSQIFTVVGIALGVLLPRIDAGPTVPTSRTVEVLGAVGKPTHQSRIVTAGGASIVWIYAVGGKETLVVFSGPGDALRVTKIRAPQD